MGRIIAIAGAIPGAGATTVASALGAAAAEQRHAVCVADATREGSRLADRRPVGTDGGVREALRRSVAPGQVLADGRHGAALLPADDGTAWGSVRPDAVADLYADLRDRFEVAVVDCGTGLSVEGTPWLGHADEVVVVTQPDADVAVRELTTTASALGVEIRGLVINRVPRREAEDAADADAPAPVLAVLPEDCAADESADEAATLLVHDPDSPVADCVWRLASSLFDPVDTPILPGPARPAAAAPDDDPSEADGPKADEGAGSPTAEVADDSTDAGTATAVSTDEAAGATRDDPDAGDGSAPGEDATPPAATHGADPGADEATATAADSRDALDAPTSGAPDDPSSGSDDEFEAADLSSGGLAAAVGAQLQGEGPEDDSPPEPDDGDPDAPSERSSDRPAAPSSVTDARPDSAPAEPRDEESPEVEWADEKGLVDDSDRGPEPAEGGSSILDDPTGAGASLDDDGPISGEPTVEEPADGASAADEPPVEGTDDSTDEGLDPEIEEIIEGSTDEAVEEVEWTPDDEEEVERLLDED